MRATVSSSNSQYMISNDLFSSPETIITMGEKEEYLTWCLNATHAHSTWNGRYGKKKSINSNVIPWSNEEQHIFISHVSIESTLDNRKSYLFTDSLARASLSVCVSVRAGRRSNTNHYCFTCIQHLLTRTKRFTVSNRSDVIFSVTNIATHKSINNLITRSVVVPSFAFLYCAMQWIEFVWYICDACKCDTMLMTNYGIWIYIFHVDVDSNIYFITHYRWIVICDTAPILCADVLWIKIYFLFYLFTLQRRISEKLPVTSANFTLRGQLASMACTLCACTYATCRTMCMAMWLILTQLTLKLDIPLSLGSKSFETDYNCAPAMSP